MTAPVDLACDCERCTSPLEARVGPILAIALMAALLFALVALGVAGPGVPAPAVIPTPTGAPAGWSER